MINRPISIALCLLTICRSYHLHRCPSKFAMSKSIRSFFVSSITDTTVVTSDGNKRAKKEHTVAATVSEVSEVDSATPTAAALVSAPAVETTASEEAPLEDTKFGWLPFDTMEPGWKASLTPQFNKPYFQSLLTFLAAESKSQTIYPPTMEIFTALNLCPLDRVKVRRTGSLYGSSICACDLIIIDFRCAISGGGDRTGPLPRCGPGARSGLLSAQRSGHPSLAQEHDCRGQGKHYSTI